MTIQEVMKNLEVNRHTIGRFQGRLIFVHNFQQYLALVDQLRMMCDVVMDIADFTEADMLPRFSELHNEVQKHAGKQIVVLSVGEYLKLCTGYETRSSLYSFRDFWREMQPAHVVTKVIMPIFGSRSFFDHVVLAVDDRQTGFIWEVDDPPVATEYSLTVYSPSFAGVVDSDAANMREWLQQWERFYAMPSRQHFSLITRLAHYAQNWYGHMQLRVVDDVFAYVASQVSDGDRLNQNDADEAIWREIAQNVQLGAEFRATIMHYLNMGQHFDAENVFSRFDTLNETGQFLVWLMYKLYPSGDYCSAAAALASAPADLPMALRDAIFQLPRDSLSKECLDQRRKVLARIPVCYNDAYFVKLDAWPMEQRLALLSYKTPAERACALRIASTLLRAGSKVEDVSALLEGYPAAAEYLHPQQRSQGMSPEVADYFRWYRQQKLINRVPEGGSSSRIEYEDIDSRFKVLTHERKEDSVLFVVDGMGVEWLPLLLHKLSKLRMDITLYAQVSKAIVPTVTEFNPVGEHNTVKWDRLDKVSHQGVPDDKDFFMCVVRQLEIIDEIVQQIAVLLQEYNSVVLTSDHGSSRLAALSFHAPHLTSIPPEGATARSFGRYVEGGTWANYPVTSAMEKAEAQDRHFLVMRGYEHFRQQGNAAGGNTDDRAVAGEVHGGMTPEEYLVPVVIVSRKVPLPLKPVTTKKKGITINDRLGLP